MADKKKRPKHVSSAPRHIKINFISNLLFQTSQIILTSWKRNSNDFLRRERKCCQYDCSDVTVSGQENTTQVLQTQSRNTLQGADNNGYVCLQEPQKGMQHHLIYTFACCE